MEITNLPEKEFRVMIVKMIQELGKSMDAQSEKLQEVFNKKLENTKDNQTELNNTITKMKTTLEGINRINEAEERVSELEDRVVKITTAEQNTEKKHGKKQGQFKRPLGQHQTHQHLQYRDIRRRGEKERD